MIGQVEIVTWADVLQQNLAVGIILFIGLGVTYVMKRCFAPDGIFTRMTETNIAATKRNSETLAKLEETSKRQQALCERHGDMAAAMLKTETDLMEWHNDPTKPQAAYKVRCGLIHACNVLGKVCQRHGVDCEDELASVRAKLE